MKSANTGRALVVISSFVLLVLLTRCSPINPSVDKRLIKNPPTNQPGIALIKVRDASGKKPSASLNKLPENLKMVEIFGEKLVEFKSESRVKVRIDDLLPEQGGKFVQAYITVSDAALDLEGFEIIVTAVDRESWVISVQADVDPVTSHKIRSNLLSLKLGFSIVDADELIELAPGGEPGRGGKGRNH